MNPEILFRDYTYRTSVSLGLVEHFRQYAESALKELEIAPGGLVVEIGSNDGSLLRAFQAHGMRVIGVDPAREIAEQATQNGVPTVPEFFNATIANDIRAAHGSAALICANNVFAHMDDMSEVTAGIRKLLADQGVFIFEVSYIVDMIDNMVFDTIYHEHVSHHALTPLERFLNRHDMTIFDVARMPTKGGSIRVFAQPLSTPTRPISERLKMLLAEEARREIVKPGVYREWFKLIEKRKRDVLDYVDGMIRAGKTVAGYGASTTTTTLLYHFELESRLKFIVDDNPLKQGMFSPGAHLPVYPPSALTELKADAAVILAWIYAKPIIERNQAFLSGGGQFLAPLPETRVIAY
ncbi:D-mycarose 3-C-methyltransferase [Methylocystis bryophila]|nr:D-mycarose 3-C-methyltransferase [Methylocystis bryophila]